MLMKPLREGRGWWVPRAHWPAFLAKYTVLSSLRDKVESDEEDT